MASSIERNESAEEESLNLISNVQHHDDFLINNDNLINIQDNFENPNENEEVKIGAENDEADNQTNFREIPI